jgi:DUF971 family protein
MAESTESRAWPTELRLHKDRRALTISFEDGTSVTLPAEYVRVESPSAEVQGHNPNERKTVPGKRNVGIMEVNPVGNYAVRLVFDDMHSTGIYSWDFFQQLGREYDQRWANYLEQLELKKLSRDPAQRK